MSIYINYGVIMSEISTRSPIEGSPDTPPGGAKLPVVQRDASTGVAQTALHVIVDHESSSLKSEHKVTEEHPEFLPRAEKYYKEPKIEIPEKVEKVSFLKKMVKTAKAGLAFFSKLNSGPKAKKLEPSLLEQKTGIKKDIRSAERRQNITAKFGLSMTTHDQELSRARVELEKLNTLDRILHKEGESVKKSELNHLLEQLKHTSEPKTPEGKPYQGLLVLKEAVDELIFNLIGKNDNRNYEKAYQIREEIDNHIKKTNGATPVIQ